MTQKLDDVELFYEKAQILSEDSLLFRTGWPRNWNEKTGSAPSFVAFRRPHFLRRLNQLNSKSVTSLSGKDSLIHHRQQVTQHGMDSRFCHSQTVPTQGTEPL